MTLPRSENLVSTMLSDTILALCRNTLQYKSEVCVEGLIGVTVDQKEVFLVHLNETILRDGGLSKSKRSDKLRKRQSEDVTDSSSESSDSKDSDSEHARSKRKRRRKRRRSKLKEVSEELAEQPKSLPTNENSQEAKDPANSDNLDKTTDSINSTRLSQPEKDSNSRNLKREKKDSDEDLVFVKEEPKEYTDNSSCSFGQSPFTLPGNPSGDSSQMYGGPPVGELGQLQEINMQMTNEQAMAINMSGQASTSSSSGGTPADQGMQFVEVHPETDAIVKWVRDEMIKEGVSQKVFAKAVLNRTQGIIGMVLQHPFLPSHQRHIWTIGHFMQLSRSDRIRYYDMNRDLMSAGSADAVSPDNTTTSSSTEELIKQHDVFVVKSPEKLQESPCRKPEIPPSPSSSVSQDGNLEIDLSHSTSPVPQSQPSSNVHLHKAQYINSAVSAAALSHAQNMVIASPPHLSGVNQTAPVPSPSMFHLPLKPRKPRTHIPPVAKRRLEDVFSRTPYISSADKIALAHELKLDEEVIKLFFQNRRAAAKNKIRVAKMAGNNPIHPTSYSKD